MGSKSDVGKVYSSNNVLAEPNSIDNYQTKYSPYLPQKNYFVMNAAEPKTSNPFNNGSQEHQLTYSEKHQSSFRPGHIISPSQQAPEGYICVGRVVESPSKKQSMSPTQNGVFFLSESSSIIRKEFPSSFNPRKAANMPSKEKVNKWIKNIPFHYNGEDDITIDCFPAVTNYSSSSSGSGENIDFGEHEAILELQARKVTRYATRLYVNEDEPVARIEEDYEDEYYDSEGNLINFNDEDIAHVDTSFAHYSNKRDAAEYIIQTTF